MQVFISDLHLIDKCSKTAIKQGAFELFRDSLKKLVQDVKKSGKPVKELKIVLLGDIFDIIRSTKWPKNGNSKIRPWSDPSTAQEEVVQNIVDDIIKENRESLKCFDDLRRFAVDEEKIPFQIQYVIGNHDWLINRYPKVIKTVADALGITDAATEFPTEICDSEYGTFARHGDIYDKDNYMGDRNKSSIGDAIVIELLNRFLEDVGLKLPNQQNIVDRLEEIDNVRPLTDIPLWVLMVMSQLNSDAQKVIVKVWRGCVDEFLKSNFVKKMKMRTRCKHWLVWRLSVPVLRFKLDRAARIIRAIKKWRGVRYDEKAWAEIRNSPFSVKYILYGHTHHHLMVSMDQVTPIRGNTISKIYFNTGTWRQTWNKAIFDKKHREFIGWKVLTYVAFYKEGENKDKNKGKDHKFEVWNGALG